MRIENENYPNEIIEKEIIMGNEKVYRNTNEKQVLPKEFESALIDVRKCEENKDVCIYESLEDDVRIITIKVILKNICEKKFVNIAVQLIDCDCGEIVSQKGRTVYTGECFDCKSTIEEYFEFAIVGNLCKNSYKFCANVIANYVNNYEHNKLCDCND